MTILEQYSIFASELNLNNIPKEVIHRAVVCICDAIDCCLVSAPDIRKDAALASFSKASASGASLWGTGLYAEPENAAFYNGVSGGVSSRNDISRISGCHPGSILVPAVLALAEEQDSSGADIVRAVIAGYETMIRFGNTLRKAGIPSTFRGSAMIGALGCAVACAVVMKLEPAKTAAAASFAAHSCFGLNEWTWAGTGEDVFQNGWAARNGIFAARLAKTGVSAASSIMEGRAGFLNAFHANAYSEYMTERLGEHYYIMDVKFKEICACINVQTAGQTAAALSRRYSPVIKDIRDIRIYCSEHSKNFPGCDNTEINNLVQAIMSIQFTVASSMVGQNPGEIKWSAPYDPEILELTKKCHLIEDKEFSMHHFEKQSSRILVTMKNGTIYQYEQKDVITPDETDVLRRFENNMKKRMEADKAQHLCTQLEQIASLPHTSSLLHQLSL